MKFNKPCKYIKKISWNTKKLLADSDKDGVSNIFDCQPHNKRKQDNEDFPSEADQRRDFVEHSYPEFFYNEEESNFRRTGKRNKDVQFEKVPQDKTDAMLTKLTKSERFNRRKI